MHEQHIKLFLSLTYLNAAIRRFEYYEEHARAHDAPQQKPYGLGEVWIAHNAAAGVVIGRVVLLWTCKASPSEMRLLRETEKTLKGLGS